jgi:outer membrane protein assembly factor BamB
LKGWNRSVTVKRLKNVDSGSDGHVKSNVRRAAAFALVCAAVALAVVGLQGEKRLVHLSAKDGSTQWSSVVPSDAEMANSTYRWFSDDGIRARDALGLMIVTSPGKVTGMNMLTGTKEWSFSVPASAKVAVGQLSAVVHSSENGEYRLTSFDLADGTQQWTHPTPIQRFQTFAISDRKGGPTALWFNQVTEEAFSERTEVVEIHVFDGSGKTLRVIEASESQDTLVFRFWRFGDDLVLDAGVILRVSLDDGTVQTLPYRTQRWLAPNGDQLLLKVSDEKLVSFDVAQNKQVWEQSLFFLSDESTALNGNVYFSGSDGSSPFSLELRSIDADGTIETVVSLEPDQGSDPRITRDGIVFDPAGKPNVGGLSGNKVTWTRHVDGRSLVHERGVTFLVEQRRWRFWLGRT